MSTHSICFCDEIKNNLETSYFRAKFHIIDRKQEYMYMYSDNFLTNRWIINRLSVQKHRTCTYTCRFIHAVLLSSSDTRLCFSLPGGA